MSLTYQATVLHVTYVPCYRPSCHLRSMLPSFMSLYVPCYRSSCHFTFHATVLHVTYVPYYRPSCHLRSMLPSFMSLYVPCYRPSCHLRSMLPSLQQTQHKHPCPQWDSDPRLRPHGHWDRRRSLDHPARSMSLYRLRYPG
jgi:hypothetical protein